MRAFRTRYDKNAHSLVRRYESLKFEQVHCEILDLIPIPPASVLDVGAGSGRDSAALAARNLKVYAVEPSKLMRQQANRVHPDTRINWIDDRLPQLSVVRKLGVKFDMILLSAVWMHVPQIHRLTALRTLAGILKRQGILVVTLRYGKIDPVKGFFAASSEELLNLGSLCGLVACRVSNIDVDKLNRQDVTWKSVVLSHNAGNS